MAIQKLVVLSKAPRATADTQITITLSDKGSPGGWTVTPASEVKPGDDLLETVQSPEEFSAEDEDSVAIVSFLKTYLG